VWHQIKHPTPSVDAYLLEEHSCHIVSRYDLIRQKLWFLKTVSPVRRKTRKTTTRFQKSSPKNPPKPKKTTAIWDQFVIQKLESYLNAVAVTKTTISGRHKPLKFPFLSLSQSRVSSDGVSHWSRFLQLLLHRPATFSYSHHTLYRSSRCYRGNDH